MKTSKIVGGLVVLAAGRLAAQGVDRSHPPLLDDPPALTLPRATTLSLPNGLSLYVVPMHEVPLVQLVLNVPGGGLADGPQPGLASFTAGMLDEGAGDRDAIAVAAQAAYLGASLSTGADWNGMTVSLKVPRSTMPQALDLMADVALRPRFAAAEVARQRDLRLAGILQRRDRPNTMASIAYAALLFPADHPYHNSIGGDSASTVVLDSATVRGFYDRYFVPRHARLIVTGDVTPEEVRELIDARFGEWRAAAADPAAGGAVPPVTSAAVTRPRTIFLVDKPGAAQSVIRMGSAGVERDNPDYYAIQVMNTILGGSFSSRLNSILREEKGYTYGAGSGFQFNPVPGPFIAGAAVRTNVTDSSLAIFFNEFDDLRHTAVSQTELDRAKAYLALGLGMGFETTSQMAGQIDGLLTLGLPLDYYDDYVDHVMSITTEEVLHAARKYLAPEEFTVVVVGDVDSIRKPIERLGLGPVAVVTMHGVPAE